MSGRVLIVDDDANFRGLAGRIIAAGGHVVVAEASTIAAAVAAAIEERPGAALIDVGLPDGSGMALAVRLSELPWHPCVVLTSADPDAASPDDVRRCGADAFIPKDQLPDAAFGRLLAEA